MRLNSCDQISLPLSIFKYAPVSLEQTEGKRCLDSCLTSGPKYLGMRYSFS